MAAAQDATASPSNIAVAPDHDLTIATPIADSRWIGQSWQRGSACPIVHDGGRPARNGCAPAMIRRSPGSVWPGPATVHAFRKPDPPGDSGTGAGGRIRPRPRRG